MNAIDRYKSLLDESTALVTRYRPEMATLPSKLKTALQDKRLRIMLFGSYNAGKSTLINALTGSNIAPIGDIPTTDDIHEYEWNSHLLLDTPGINAPITHQEVSEAELKRADLVIFVIRQEDQDTGDTMRRLFELLNASRPVFLLLNYDNGAPELLARIREKLAMTLSGAADQYGYDRTRLENLPNIAINIHSALRARHENKELLRANSGYDEFIARFNDWLRHHEEYSKRINLFHGRVVRELVHPIRERIDQGNVKNPEILHIAEQLTHLRRERSNLGNYANNHIRKNINLRRPEIGELLDQPIDQQAIITKVTQISEDITEAVQGWLRNEIEQSLGKAATFPLIAGNIDASIDLKEGNSAAIMDKACNALLEGTKKTATPDNITKLLLLGRKLKIPFLKGRWEKTLSRWAGKAAPVVTAVVSFAQVGMAHRAQEKENALELNAVMQKNQWVDGVCAQLQEDLMATLNERLNTIFDEVIVPLQKERSALTSTAEGIEKDILFWDALADKLDLAHNQCIDQLSSPGI